MRGGLADHVGGLQHMGRNGRRKAEQLGLHHMGPLAPIRLRRTSATPAIRARGHWPAWTFSQITFAVCGRCSGRRDQCHGGRRRIHDFPAAGRGGNERDRGQCLKFVAVLPANVVGTGSTATNSPGAGNICRCGSRWRRPAALIGSPILVWSGPGSFRTAIPWLLLFATFSFAAGPWLKTRLERALRLRRRQMHVAVLRSRIHRLCLWRLFRPWHGHRACSPSIRSSRRCDIHEANAIRNAYHHADDA